MSLPIVLSLALRADAQDVSLVVSPDRPLVPHAGIAAESGPGALWVNPANLAFDPDPRSGLYVATDLGDDPISWAVTTGTGGVSFGIHNVIVPSEFGNDVSDWSLDYGTSVRLAPRVAVGFRTAWHIKDEEDNFVSYDVGAAWRPLPWFGVAAAGHNVLSADAVSGVGVAFRPFDRLLTLSADFRHDFDPVAPESHVIGALRIRPTRGLFLRGSVDADLEGNLMYGGGLELFFGNWGGGMNAVMGPDATGLVAFVGTEDPGEALIRAGDKVPVLVLDHAPPYEKETGFLAAQDTTWLEILELLRRSEDDNAVRGLAIVLQGAGLSWAQAEELRARIAVFEASGKPVTAYLYGSGGSTDYFVATAASHIVVHPSEDVWITGVGSEQQYLRGAFDLVGVEPQFVRRKEYKSAVEQYTATEPSPPSMEQTDALLDDLYGALVKAIAEGRGKDEAAVQALIDGGPYTARGAYDKGLVDEIAYPDEVEESIKTHLGRSSIDLTDLSDMPQPHSGWQAASQIAVVYVDGAITSGRSGGGGFMSGATSGSVTVVNALDQAREDDQVRAVVLRVDSPGGSSFASDDIHRAIERIQEEGKPVVVSMGGVAASGGYYVACGADAIWAEPTTITGSIGVYSGKFATGELMDRVGIHTAGFLRGRNADINSSTQPWDALQVEHMDAMVGAVYADFTGKVAEGRGLTIEQVEEVARGRVWTGSRGHERALVDNIGGLQEAIDDARVRANIPAGRQVGLVSYSRSGILQETLAPTQMGVSEVTVKLLFPQLAAKITEGRALPPLVQNLADAFGPALLIAEEPNVVWMYDPSTEALARP